MALATSTPFATPFGTTAPSLYWRWVSANIDLLGSSVTVVLNGYVDAAAFAAGKQPVATRALNIAGADFWGMAASIDGPSPTPISELIYARAKASDEYFADAEEV